MLNSNAEVLQEVLDAMQDMLRVLDLSQRVVLSNRSYNETFGPQQGKACNEMFCLAGTCRVCISKQALLTGKTHQKIRRFRGRTYSVNASPLYDTLRAPVGTVEVFRDITEQERQRATLHAQNKRLLREANLAARMQRELFLSTSRPDPRVEVNSRYLPASSLGGDMFGCLAQQGGKTAFYIADVSGHGMAAAMITLLLANVMRSIQAGSAAEILNAARDAFVSCVKEDLLYAAMFAALLDPSTGRLAWANAGLNAVPLLAQGETLTQLYAPSLPISNWGQVSYVEQTLTLEPGARLLLYTDGLLDARSSRLTEAELERRFLRQDGGTLLTYLEKQVLPNHEDDVCMLHIIYRGSGAGIEHTAGTAFQARAVTV